MSYRCGLTYEGSRILASFLKLFLESYLPPSAAFLLLLLFLPIHSQNCGPFFSSFSESKILCMTFDPSHPAYHSHSVLFYDVWAIVTVVIE